MGGGAVRELSNGVSQAMGNKVSKRKKKAVIGNIKALLRPNLSKQQTDVHSPSQAEQLANQGNASFDAGRYGEAIDLYTKAMNTQVVVNPEYLVYRAASYMALKRFHLAHEDYHTAVNHQSCSPQLVTLLSLARCKLVLGAIASALSTVNTAISVDPINPSTLQLKRGVVELENKFQDFVSAKDREDWDAACLALDGCLQAVADYGARPVQWQVWRVELDLTRGNWTAAEAASHELLCSECDSVEIQALCARVTFLCGNLPQALEHASQAARLDSRHEWARKLWEDIWHVKRIKEDGDRAFNGKRFIEALDNYNEALDRVVEVAEERRNSPIRARVLLSRAITLFQLERHKEALSDVDISLAMIPTSVDALHTRARMKSRLDMYEAAVADFKSASYQARLEGNDSGASQIEMQQKVAERRLKAIAQRPFHTGGLWG